MSFSWRKQKRIKAHLILKALSEVAFRHTFKPENEEFIELGAIMNSIHQSPISIQKSLPFDAEYSVWMTTIAELIENQDVEKGEQPGYKMPIKITLKGEESYRSSYYLVENRKDRLQELEYYTKWVLPVISIILSVAALMISFVVLVHSWNKK